MGGLFAAAACLYLYKGYGRRENVALNLAGVFAALVALFPTARADEPAGPISTLHGTSAVLFFACIAYVSLRRSQDTLDLLSPARRALYARRYVWTGLALVASPVVAVALSYALEPTTRLRTAVFWVESLGIWAFAAYWTIKTLEMRETQAERRALRAELRRDLVAAAKPGEPEPARPPGVTGSIAQKIAGPPQAQERIVPADPPAP